MARPLLVAYRMSFLVIATLLLCPAATGFIDRIEGPRAVLLTPGGSRDIPARCLPRGAVEGFFLIRGRLDGRTFRHEIREVQRLMGRAAAVRAPPVPVP